MVSTQGLERMKQARARLVLNQLFFGSASMGLRFVVDENCATAYTDGRIIGFSPAFIDSFSDIAHVEFIVCHETLHCLMMHPLRLQGREHRLANIAMDYVINGICKRAGLKLPKECLYDDKLSASNMSFEIVYALLAKEEKEKKAKAGNGGQGSGSGRLEPWQMGEVREAKSASGHEMSEAERAQLENDWKLAAAKALAQARNAGTVPAGMERLIKDLTVKKRDLEDVLRDFMVRTFDGDYTWGSPNKRHIIRDIYLPSIKGGSIPLIAMVMDTSGSIDQEQVSYFQAKVNSVLSEFNTTVRVIYCDSHAYDGGEFTNNDLPLKLKPKGGGGTNFRPPFQFIEEHDIEPTCMIYYTDGYCSAFPNEPDYPVLWAIYGQERQVPFGEVVMLNPQ
jgi:predicted metal-dependent peptidase